MNEDQREALKQFLMIGAPITLFIGSILPQILIVPIAITLFFGTLIFSYWSGDINQEQQKWRAKIIIISIIILFITWSVIIIEFLK